MRKPRDNRDKELYLKIFGNRSWAVMYGADIDEFGEGMMIDSLKELKTVRDWFDKCLSYLETRH